MNKKKRNGKFTPRGVKKKPAKSDRPKQNNFNQKDELKEGKNTFLPMMNIDLQKLPSKGIPYPKGAVVKYRPYSWGEVKEITQSKMSKKDQFKHIMKGITVEGMEKNDLTLGDAMYLAIYRKFSTVGDSKISVQYFCKGCSRKSKGVFNLQEVGQDFMKAPKLPMTISIVGQDYSFKPLTITDYFNISDKLEEKEDLDPDFALIATMCTNAEFDQVYEALYNVSDQDEMEDIKLIDHYLNHGLNKVKNKCRNVLDNKGDDSENEVLCNHVSEIELDGGQALLLPFREDEERPRSRVRFGDET